MEYLAGTDSVHTTAAICDYLEDRATSDDSVTVVAAVDDATTRQDAQEALTVAPVRLAGVGHVETAVHDGQPESVLPTVADEIDADELVVGAYSGNPTATTTVGSTTTALLERTTRPVVVVPIPEL
ncbi:universal stress protein [Natronolimnobius baerhuensis]|uniref:Universal stress protein UspA n=1 Tax=Natronolimnobius baerhuensis TaxID=253108 RepID=A0A202ECP4_9EURY|nr:universal stress protein [Natronolimnobius baerhuensis]OVE85948.1 universal stress protein UspA [Natronolimnobius baerhuensis]